ncbi:MAG TPA: hypothetical protein VLZ89_14210 [Anaerolineales bacterium]|nr:hypothetical protein [Anaerolineales bacterium]
MSEHRLIERLINPLENAAHYPERGGEVRPGFFVEAADFIQGFADGCHHQKEEDILFRARAHRILPLEQQERLAHGFEQLEHDESGEGIHERYLALAAALEQEAESLRPEA